VTSEDNFTNDAMYLVEGVLPTNHTLRTVEIDWSFLEPLEEGERDRLLRGIASLQSIQEILIRGGADEESRLCIKSILIIPELATNIEHLSVEVSEIAVQDAVDLELLACRIRKCQRLQSLHLRGLLSDNETVPLDCNTLLTSLATLPTLNVIHVSQKDGQRKPVTSSTLRQVCRLPGLASLSLMNMGLTDSHCTIFLEEFKYTKTLHSLVLVDNPSISEDGNETLLELLRNNRSIYNSTFGTDSDTKFRVEQLSLLHMNRCGRRHVRSPANLNEWTKYVARINETVPEELELDALFTAVKENPEFFQGGYAAHLVEPVVPPLQETITVVPTVPPALPVDALIDNMEARLLQMRRMELDLQVRQQLLERREEALAQQLRTIQELEERVRQEKEEEKIVEDKSSQPNDLLSLCSGSAAEKADGTLTTVPSSLAWETLSQIEQQTNETLQMLRDECWGFSSLGSLFHAKALF
jgi:hypothetical protein